MFSVTGSVSSLLKPCNIVILVTFEPIKSLDLTVVNGNQFGEKVQFLENLTSSLLNSPKNTRTSKQKQTTEELNERDCILYFPS